MDAEFPTFRGFGLPERHEKMLDAMLERQCRAEGVERHSLEAVDLSATLFSAYQRAFRAEFPARAA